MRIVSADEVHAHWSAFLDASALGPVVVTRNGKAVAVLVAAGDDDELERLLMAHSPKLQAILNAARQRIQEGKGIPHDQFWEQVDNARKKKGSGKKRKSGRSSRSS
jgi:antitoxin (DNA-binding transcriptional repressor) of toxin-antitoxin stability system